MLENAHHNYWYTWKYATGQQLQQQQPAQHSLVDFNVNLFKIIIIIERKLCRLNLLPLSISSDDNDQPMATSLFVNTHAHS